MSSPPDVVHSPATHSPSPDPAPAQNENVRDRRTSDASLSSSDGSDQHADVPTPEGSQEERPIVAGSTTTSRARASPPPVEIITTPATTQRAPATGPVRTNQQPPLVYWPVPPVQVGAANTGGHHPFPVVPMGYMIPVVMYPAFPIVYPYVQGGGGASNANQPARAPAHGYAPYPPPQPVAGPSSQPDQGNRDDTRGRPRKPARGDKRKEKK